MSNVKFLDAPPLDILEGPFQAQIVKTAEHFGWRVVHYRNSRKQLRNVTARGYGDLTLARENDRILFREIKKQDGTTSTDQDDWIRVLNSANGDAGVWRPSDWEEIIRALT